MTAARMSAQDRAGLERLLLYVLRPALSLKQLDKVGEISPFHAGLAAHGVV